MTELQERLRNVGFYRILENKDALIEEVQQLNKSAGLKTSQPSFEAFPSFIPAKTVQMCLPYELVIDIGGTSTKIGVRNCKAESNEYEWLILFEEKNFRLEKEGTDSFSSFCEVVSARLVSSLRENDIPLEAIHYCAVIWSNAIENKPNRDFGITGIVADRSSYRKGEWFIKDLQDGDDIGKIFVSALKEVGIAIKYFIISNDTVFTMTALPGADAGMVASTGLNGTLVKPSTLFIQDLRIEHIICNGEIGGRTYIKENLLSDGDWITPMEKANTIEYLTAGRFLPYLFIKHILLFAELDFELLKPVAERLRSYEDGGWHSFRAKDMALLLYDAEHFVRRRKVPEVYTRSVLNVLKELSAEFFVRSAKLCAIVAFSTVVNQLEDRDKVVVALDSRLAREVPLFWTTLESEILEITPLGKEIDIQLLNPLALAEGKVSVPMQGGANALDSLVASMS